MGWDAWVPELPAQRSSSLPVSAPTLLCIGLIARSLPGSQEAQGAPLAELGTCQALPFCYVVGRADKGGGPLRCPQDSYQAGRPCPAPYEGGSIHALMGPLLMALSRSEDGSESLPFHKTQDHSTPGSFRAASSFHPGSISWLDPAAPREPPPPPSLGLTVSSLNSACTSSWKPSMTLQL